MRHRYFAYGSNLDPVHLRRCCPSHRALGRAVLADHRLTFPVRSEGDWAGGVASVEPSPGRDVHGVVYAVDDADLATLDLYEAVAEGMYRRRRVSVRLEPEAETVTAWTYFAVPDPAGPTPPSARYRQALIDGAVHHGLPAGYIEQLRAIVVLDESDLH
jgi:gamma-glutamylcyclotransferase (GGCT)/AIG2-like uncharacterized protein YtfP